MKDTLIKFGATMQIPASKIVAFDLVNEKKSVRVFVVGNNTPFECNYNQSANAIKEYDGVTNQLIAFYAGINQADAADAVNILKT